MHKEIARLQLITQDDPEISHQEMALNACQSGVKWLQLRMKQADEREVSAVALEVKQICDKFGATFIIDDQVEIAKTVDADGVHLGKLDMSPDEARKILGQDKIIGGTANTFDDIAHLSALGVDYIGVGPYRFTSTKQNLSPILGLCGYHEINERCMIKNIDIPLIAIGGIRKEDVEDIVKAGMHGVAVASAINYAKDIRKEIEGFLNQLNYAKT